MYGTAAIAAVDAVLIGAGAAILSVPSALAIGLLTFVLSFVPFVGAVIAGLFAVLLALADGGPGRALAMLAVVVVVPAGREQPAPARDPEPVRRPAPAGDHPRRRRRAPPSGASSGS